MTSDEIVTAFSTNETPDFVFAMQMSDGNETRAENVARWRRGEDLPEDGTSRRTQLEYLLKHPAP